ncbi:MFS transporter [Streptomyces roseus]|uniref:MFS transporter n=1 Tax=Streptomyces roseus TaxID=66430 RepID=A0A0J7AA23_9ACTN|nr:MFS transporter [Streptomyces roseus]KMO94146.1 MFS transporter [Streptomyces roseus]MYT21968.1 MFS transporter [Streptomyces sp. SID7760]
MTELKPKAGTKEWIGLGVIVLVTLLVSVDVSVLGFAIAPLSEDISPTASQLLWIMDIYSFVLAGTLVTVGWLGDRIGRRKLLLIGAALFGVASACAAFSTSPEMLIASRALLGLAASTLTPTSLALIRNMFHDSKERKTAIAAWGGTLTSGAAIGPVVGGLLLNNFWWGSVFLINTPVMVLVLLSAPFLLPEYRDPNRGKLDLLSTALSLAGVMTLIYGFKELVIEGYSQGAVIWAVVGAVLVIAFVIRQKTAANPMINISLFRSGGFSGAVIVNLMVAFALMGSSVLTNQYLQMVLGYSPLTASLWSLAPMPAIGIAVALSASLGRKVRPAVLIGSALVIMAAGFGVLTMVEVDSSIAIVLVGVGLLAGGMVASKTLAAEIVVTSAPPEQAGSSVATSETFTEFGIAFGFASLGSIGSAVYRDDMAKISPEGVTGSALDSLRNTIGGAADVAAHQSQQVGAQVIDASREAFTHGLQVASVAGAALMLLTAVVTTLLLRKTPIEAALPGAVEAAQSQEPQHIPTTAGAASTPAAAPHSSVAYH